MDRLLSPDKREYSLPAAALRRNLPYCCHPCPKIRPRGLGAHRSTQRSQLLRLRKHPKSWRLSGVWPVPSSSAIRTTRPSRRPPLRRQCHQSPRSPWPQGSLQPQGRRHLQSLRRSIRRSLLRFARRLSLPPVLALYPRGDFCFPKGPSSIARLRRPSTRRYRV
jgi:hypothetical protein